MKYPQLNRKDFVKNLPVERWHEIKKDYDDTKADFVRAWKVLTKHFKNCKWEFSLGNGIIVWKGDKRYLILLSGEVQVRHSYFSPAKNRNVVEMLTVTM